MQKQNVPNVVCGILWIILYIIYLQFYIMLETNVKSIGEHDLMTL